MQKHQVGTLAALPRCNVWVECESIQSVKI
jgi:hypothetical protein